MFIVTDVRVPAPADPRMAGGRIAWVALGAVYLLWSSTYLANRLIITGVPPLLSGGVRFVVGGLRGELGGVLDRGIDEVIGKQRRPRPDAVTTSLPPRAQPRTRAGCQWTWTSSPTCR